MIELTYDFSPGFKASIVVTLIIIVLSIVVGRRIEKKDPTAPIKGPLFVVVMVFDMLNSFIKQFYGEEWRRFAPILIAVLMFLVFANTATLIGLETPLASFSVAITFSIIAFLIIQVSGLIVRRPLQRFKDLSSPSVLLLPVNVISEISTPFAMGLRLFGNLLSGSVIAAIIFNLLGSFGSLIATAGILHPIFNLGFGLIQAFVYFMLLTIFLAMSVEAEGVSDS